METVSGTYHVAGRWLPVFSQKVFLMRFSAIFFLVLSQQIAARAVSQTVSLSGKDLSLTRIFDAVKEQTNYLVFYDKDIISNWRPVTVRVKNMPLNEFLDRVFKSQTLDFYIENQTIFIRKKPLAQPASVQKIEEKKEVLLPPVTGVVTDADGKPLAGANVIIKGSKEA